MTMKEKIRIHAAIEAADKEHRLWFLNSQTLDWLTASYPIGAMVENFGVLAEVVGYQARGKAYTGDLILREPETGMRWIGKTDFCRVCA